MPTDVAAERAAAVRAGRITVGRQVDAATRAIVEAYTRAWQQVRDDLVAAAVEAEARALATGDVANPAAYRTARLQASLRELTRQLRALARIAGVEVTGLVPPAVTVPRQVISRLSKAGGLRFNLPPSRALEAVVRRSVERIASDYAALSADAEQALRTALLRGVAGGRGVDPVARDMVREARRLTAARHGVDLADLEAGQVAERIVTEVRGAFGGGMSRALVLARTELIDASRYATTASYLASPGLITGWRWLATLDARTCPACWSMHGRLFKPDEHLAGHQQCRCVSVPVLATDRPGDGDVGHAPAAFRALPREQQLQVMGPARLAYLDAGGAWDRLAVRRDNPGWRHAHYATPVRDLTG